MPKRLIFIGFFILFFSQAMAQEKMIYQEVETSSYQLFLEEKWPELILLSEEANQHGIDFFYLQFRTGIAWYSLGKYRKANHYFLKAYSQDRSNEWLQEYVYYSLVFSGRNFEANKLAASFADGVKEKIGFQARGLTLMGFETSYGFNQDFDQLKNRDFSGEIDLGEDYGEGYFLKNYTYQSLDLSHRITSNFTLNHNLTYYSVNREAYVNWGEQTISPIGINQFNYFINPVLVIGKKLNISPSLTVIWGDSDVYAGQWNNNFTNKEYGLTKVNYSDVILSTAIWSDFGNFSPGLEFNTGNINNTDLSQLSAWLSYYPFSNTKLYFSPRIYFKSDAQGFGLNAIGITCGATIGKFHIIGQYLGGEMENFIESAGYTIFNFPGKSDRKIMGSVYFPLHKKYRFVLRYIQRNVTEKYQVYTLGTKSNSLEYNYLMHTITAGISWKL